jgi:Bacterial CdiA-CT RNAse A domain
MRVRADVDDMRDFSAALSETVRVIADNWDPLKRRAGLFDADQRLKAIKSDVEKQHGIMIMNRLDELRSLTARLNRLAAHLRLYLDASANSSPPTPSLSTSLAPRGGLMAHEASPERVELGHTLEKHVGWTIDQMKDRLGGSEGLPRVGTFNDRAEAEKAIGMVFADPGNQKKLANWLASDSDRVRLEISLSCGTILMRGSSKTVRGTSVRVAVRKHAEYGYYIVTSFPQVCEYDNLEPES